MSPSTSRQAAVVIFLAFALAYFFSALLRAVTATLAPVFSVELGLGSADLGLLAGAFFLGFALMQLPLGKALDRYGPKPVLLLLLLVAAFACVGFALADGLLGLVLARALIGVGVSACLMAPLTCFRRLFAPALQLRTNSWMLMTGSLGMLCSTVPVQLLLPVFGWRGLFWCMALLLVLSAGLILRCVPKVVPLPQQALGGGYRQVARHPMFIRLAPLGFFLYGGMIATQALWAGPWLTRVAGRQGSEAAAGLFIINACMLVAFMAWGTWMPRIAARGIDAQRLLAWGVPLSLALLALNIALGPLAGPWHWAAWCVASTCITPSQPALGQAFEDGMAGRALSAYNLVIFAGVFALQWGIGLAIDQFRHLGFDDLQAFRGAFFAFWFCCLGAYLWYLKPPWATKQ